MASRSSRVLPNCGKRVGFGIVGDGGCGNDGCSLVAGVVMGLVSRCDTTCLVISCLSWLVMYVLISSWAEEIVQPTRPCSRREVCPRMVLGSCFVPRALLIWFWMVFW